MVVIETGGERATILGRVWTAARPALARALNDDVAIRQTSIGYEPWPDLAIAEEAIQRYGGRIIQQAPPDHVPGRVY